MVWSRASLGRPREARRRPSGLERDRKRRGKRFGGQPRHAPNRSGRHQQTPRTFGVSCVRRRCNTVPGVPAAVPIETGTAPSVHNAISRLVRRAGDNPGGGSRHAADPGATALWTAGAGLWKRGPAATDGPAGRVGEDGREPAPTPAVFAIAGGP